MNKISLRLLFLLFIISFAYTVEAASCNVVSGSGFDIGDEIVCGTEHFYLLENDGSNIKMLSKYNLYVGYDYYKYDFPEALTSEEADDYIEEHYPDVYNDYWDYVYNEDNKYTGILVRKYLENDVVKQDSIAIGAHGDKKGSPLFPERGVYLMYIYDDFYDYYNDVKSIETYSDGYVDIEFDVSSDLIYYLDQYEHYLSSNNVMIKNFDILSVKDISNLIKNITEKELPLNEWWDQEWDYIYDGLHYDYYVVGSILDTIPSDLRDKYTWIWSTTYWTKTVESYSYDVRSISGSMYFVDTLGNLCNTYACEAAVGAGIRPVVTIDASNINYKIDKKVIGSGEIKVDKEIGAEGEDVSFTLLPSKGFVLGKVRVFDKDGNETVIKDNHFVMPNSNVIIEAVFLPENPDTGATIHILMATILFVLSLKVWMNVNKKKRFIKL